MTVCSSRPPACLMAQSISSPASQPSWLFSIALSLPRPAACMPAMYSLRPVAVALSVAEVPAWAWVSQEGWDAGLEIDWAIKQAGGLDEQTVMQKLQHLDINTLGIVWTRTASNHESYSDVDAAMAIINPDGSASLYKPAS